MENFIFCAVLQMVNVNIYITDPTEYQLKLMPLQDGRIKIDTYMIAGIPRGFKNPRKESVNEKNDKQPSGTKKRI